MASELEHQLRPFSIILRRICPASEQLAGRGKIVAIWLGMGGERLGHESEFDERLGAGLAEGIEYAIDDLPVVNGLSRSIFGIDIRRTPFQRCRAVTGGEEVVDADV